MQYVIIEKVIASCFLYSLAHWASRKSGMRGSFVMCSRGFIGAEGKGR